MRYLYLFFLLLPLSLRAQQPFAQFGIQVKVLSLTNGRYPEEVDNDSLRRIGSVVYDTRRGQVAYLLPADSLRGRPEADISSRGLVVDPLAAKDAFISPYAFCRNNALLYKDPDGRSVFIAYEANGDDRRVKYESGKLYGEDGKAYRGKNPYVIQVCNQLDQLRKGDTELAERLACLQESKQEHTLKMLTKEEKARGDKNTTKSTDPEATEKGLPSGTLVKYDPNDNTTNRGEKRDPRAGLAHELLGHGPQHNTTKEKLIEKKIKMEWKSVRPRQLK